MHGEAWLGILNMGGPLNGKTWVLHAPGELLARDSLAHLNPYAPVIQQIADIQGLATVHNRRDDYEEGTRYVDLAQNSNSTLQLCLQRPGDIFYVPAGWPHLTLNNGLFQKNVMYCCVNVVPCTGEVYALGEQHVWLADVRESFCKNVLRSNPNDYDSLKGLAIALLSKLKDSRNKPRAAEANRMMLKAKQSLRYVLYHLIFCHTVELYNN